MWMKIICHFLILGKHIMYVTHDMVCLVYALMQDDIYINVAVVILSIIMKARYNQGQRYGFEG